MKKIITLVLFFFLTFRLEGVAQQPGDKKPLASNSSFKGRRELRKEKRVQRKEKKLTKKNERIGKSTQKDVQVSKFGIPKKRKHKERNNKKSDRQKPMN